MTRGPKSRLTSTKKRGGKSKESGGDGRMKARLSVWYDSWEVFVGAAWVPPPTHSVSKAQHFHDKSTTEAKLFTRFRQEASFGNQMPHSFGFVPVHVQLHSLVSVYITRKVIIISLNCQCCWNSQGLRRQNAGN
jgi:hypothetical protein